MASFVTTPTHDWIEQRLRLCSSRFLVSSPYITSFLSKIVASIPEHVSKVLLTRTDLRDFAFGASDIEALCEVARHGTKILSLSGLHAKVYIIDNKQALITSANATHGGMYRNWECGVALKNATDVKQIANLLLSGFGADPLPQQWSLDALEKLRGPVQTLREQLPPIKELPKLDTLQLPSIKLKEEAQSLLIAKFSGWTQLTVEGIFAQPEFFTLDGLMTACYPLASVRYPRNQYVREQIRKQLQQLRDLGVVEFLGGGNYKRIIQIEE